MLFVFMMLKDIKPGDAYESLHFYIKLCRSLIVLVKTHQAKILCAKWLKRIHDDIGTDLKTRFQYLTSLMFMMMKQSLFGPFMSPPPNPNEKLLPLEAKYHMQNISQQYLYEKYNKPESKQQRNRDFPPICYTISSDSREYAAVQSIPSFGTQMYLASSVDPMETWPTVPRYLHEIDHVDYHHPCLDVIANINQVSCFIDPNVLGVKQETVREPVHEKSRPCVVVPSGRVSFPSAGALRSAPTWGSNLIGVKPDEFVERWKKHIRQEDTRELLFNMFTKVDTDTDLDVCNNYVCENNSSYFYDDFMKNYKSEMDKKSNKQEKKTNRLNLTDNNRTRNCSGKGDGGCSVETRNRTLNYDPKTRAKGGHNENSLDGLYNSTTKQVCFEPLNDKSTLQNREELRRNYTSVIKSCLTKRPKSPRQKRYETNNEEANKVKFARNAMVIKDICCRPKTAGVLERTPMKKLSYLLHKYNSDSSDVVVAKNERPSTSKDKYCNR